jgi:hypothetical protein
MEQIDEPVRGRLVQHQPVSVSMGPGVDRDSERPADRVLESRGGCNKVRVWDSALSPRCRIADDRGFEVSNGPSLLGGTSGEVAAAVVVGFGQEGFAVALREPAAVD